MEIFAFIIVATPLFIWSVLFLIECGVAMLGPWAKKTGCEEVFAHYIGPVWETTNVFLVFALVALMAFFPGALPVWSAALIVPFFLFLAAMGIRALGMLMVFYGGENKHPAGAWTLALGGLLAPAVFAGEIVSYFMTGAAPFSTASLPIQIGFAAFAAGGALILASSYFGYVSRRMSAIPLTATLIGFIAFFVAMTMRQYPYIVYPSLDVSSVFAASAVADPIFAISVVGAVITLPAVAWLLSLFAFRSRRK